MIKRIDLTTDEEIAELEKEKEAYDDEIEASISGRVTE